MANLQNRIKDNHFIRSLVYRIRLFEERFSYRIGHNNTLIICGIKIGSRIQIRGNANEVLVENGAVLKRARLFIQGDGNTIIIRSRAYLEESLIYIEDNNCKIEIGERTFIGPSHIACTEDGRSIFIGKDCMLSSNINVRTGDSHSILDCDGKRLNPAESVVIGDHCWVGEGAKIMKGVNLNKDTIVASGSIVTHSFPSNVILAGNPAKIIKEDISWDKKRI